MQQYLLRRLLMTVPVLFGLSLAIFGSIRVVPGDVVVSLTADAGNVRVDYANGLDSSAGLLYSVRTFDQDSSLSVNPGWDDVTGLGSPNSGWLTAIH